MTDIQFGDTDWQDAIDVNPLAVPDYNAVKLRLNAELETWKARGLGLDDQAAGELARDLILLAVLKFRSRSLDFIEEIELEGAASPEYQALDIAGRQTVRLIVGLIVVWLLAEHSLV